MFSLSLRQYPVDFRIATSVILASLVANVAVGFAVRRVGLPIYLDTIGTVMATILLGWRWGLLAAALSVTLGSLLIWPLYFFYSFTAVGLVVTVEFLRRISLFDSQWKAVWAGLILAVVAALLSAPVTAYFKAATFSGNDIITAFFRSMGNSLIQSVFLSGFASEPVDKALTCVIVFHVIKAFPEYTLKRYHLRGLAGDQ